MVVEIDGFEALECEHAVGPSYLLTAADRKRLGIHIRRYRPVNGLGIVGFFRSHTRKGFAATAEDVSLMSAYFSKPSMVLLLIQAAPEGLLKGGFSIWEDRRMRTSPYLEFPFDSAALLASMGREKPEERPIAGPSLVPPLVKPPTAKRLPRPPLWPATLTMPWRWHVPQWRIEPHLAQPLWGFLRRARTKAKIEWTVAVAILASAGVVGVLYRGYTRGEAPPRPLLTASRGSSAGGDSGPAPIAPAAVQAPAETAAAPSDAGATEDQQPAAPTPGTRARKAAHKGQTATADRTITAESLEPKPAPPPPLPGPPELAMAPETAPAPLSGIWAETPSITNPFVNVAVDPVPNGHSGTWLGKVFGSHRKQAGFVPPTLVRQVPVDVPLELRHRVQREVPVDVKTHLDRTGKVEYAELLSKGTGPFRDLAALAVFSSRGWEFSPARVGDETIPAEVVLRFRFGPAN
jgi:hypothetical protein